MSNVSKFVSANRWAFVALAVMAFALGVFASRANADAPNWMIDPVGGVPVTDPGDSVPGPTHPPLFYPLQAGGGDWTCEKIGGAMFSSTTLAAGEAGPAAPLIGALAAGAWTRGCQIGASHNDPPTIIDGLPRHHTRNSFYAVHWVNWRRWKEKHVNWVQHHPTWLQHERTWFSHHHWGTRELPLHKRYWFV